VFVKSASPKINATHAHQTMVIRDGQQEPILYQHTTIATAQKAEPVAMRVRLKDRFSLIKVC
jgi:hypothetical protein